MNGGGRSGYVRQAGFDRIQQRQMVLQYLEDNERIRRSEVAELCRISPHQATRLLARLVQDDEITRYGQRKGTFYERKQQ